MLTLSLRYSLDAQLPYTSYLSLGLPSAYLGLGRTNNYVENLFIGSTRSHQSNHFINLEGVIPNSQVLILPFQSKEAPTTTEEGEVELWEGDTSEWRKELYLKPGDWIPWVTLVLVTAIIGLGIVVFVLHLNEKVSFSSLSFFFWLGMKRVSFVLIFFIVGCFIRGKMKLKGELGCYH